MERESEEKYKGTVETEVEREGCKRSADFSIPTVPSQVERCGEWRSGERYSVLRVGRPGRPPEQAR